MHITKFEDALSYHAPGHFDMLGLRLQGAEVSEANNFWVGFSQFLPGGGAEIDASPAEKVYVVLEGSIIVIQDENEYILKPYDSCYIGPNESRSIINTSNHTAKMLVIIANSARHDKR